MIDEMFDRHYQAARRELNRSIGSALKHFSRAIANAFKVLNRIEYEAPWTARPRRIRSR